MKPDNKINILALILFTLLLIGYSLEGSTQTLEEVRTYLEDRFQILALEYTKTPAYKDT